MWLESSGRLQRFCTLYGWGGWITPSYKDIWKQSVVGFQKVGTSGLVWHAIWCLVSTTFTTYLAMRSIHPSALQKLHRAPLGHMHIKFKWTACFTENNSKRVAIGLSDLYLIVVVLLSIQAQHWSVQSSTVSYLRFIRALILRKVRWFSFLVAACFLVWNSLDDCDLWSQIFRFLLLQMSSNCSKLFLHFIDMWQTCFHVFQHKIVCHAYSIWGFMSRVELLCFASVIIG